MKTFAWILTTVVLTAGCAATDKPYLHEAYHLDREWGQAQQYTWDLQVAYPDYRYAAKTPEDLEGINAEEVMNVNNKTFAEKPEKVDIFTLGLVGEQ